VDYRAINSKTLLLLFSEPSLHDRRYFGLSTARLGEELGSLLVAVGDGGEDGRALGVKLGDALLVSLELAIGSPLRPPIGEGARLESDNTL
jgi:hypothetical protein